MDTATFSEYLEKRYKDQLDYYEKASGRYQKWYKNSQWALIIFSTLTTILAAMPKSDNYDLQYVVVGSAALVTILTSALKTFQYQELWVNYRGTIEQLKPEIFYYQFGAGDYGQQGIDKEILFVTRVEGILNKEHDAWPVYKKMMNTEGKPDKQNDDIQKKLEDLVREKFNTTKTNPVAADPKQATDELAPLVNGDKPAEIETGKDEEAPAAGKASDDHAAETDGDDASDASDTAAENAAK